MLSDSPAPAIPQKGAGAKSSLPDSPEADSVEAAPIVHLTFWQHPAVQNLLPFATSIVFHIALILIVALAWATHAVITGSVIREQVIIPEAAIIDGAAVGGIPNPGLGGDPNLSSAQNADPGISVADGWASKRSESLTAALMGGGATDAADSVIGLGLHAGLVGTGGRGAGGDGGEGGGATAPFGPPGGGMGLGPQAPFIGISGNARRVVYICDASGSMLDKFDKLQSELRKSVDVLRPIQAFNIIFFKDAGAIPLSKDNGLVIANPENKRKAYEFIQSTYVGPNSDPIPALELAFKQQPELIYLLTDGEFPRNEAVIELIRKLNSSKRIKVNTLLLFSAGESPSSNPTLAIVERSLRLIASENGGLFKPVPIGN